MLTQSDSRLRLEIMVLGQSHADSRPWRKLRLCKPLMTLYFLRPCKPLMTVFFQRTQTTHHSMSIVISLFIERATSRLLLDKFLMQMEQCIDRQCDDAQCVASFSSIMCMSDYEVIGIGFLILSSMNQFTPYLMISNLSELFIRLKLLV